MTALKIRESRFDPPSRRRRGTTNPDTWSSGWAVVGGAMLLLAFVLPGSIARPYGWFPETETRWLWEEWTSATPAQVACLLMPLAVGGACLFAALRTKGAERARILLAASGAVAVAWIASDPRRSDRGFTLPVDEDHGLVQAGILLALWAVAVGVHLQRRFGDLRLPRLLSLVGGAGLLVTLGALVARYPGSTESWFFLLFPFAYAGLAIASGLTEREGGLFPNILGWAHRLGLSGVLVVLGLQGPLKLATLLAGAAIVVPLGPAAWLEASLGARSAAWDAQSVAKVFR